jgi:hypothetical protein
MANLDIALEHLDRGWSIIPINPETKRPLLEWLEFQKRHPTEEEVCDWWTRWPYAMPAVITGAISQVYIVDVDSDDALGAAKDLGLTSSPVQTRTKRGRHFWWAHPNDGRHRGPRVGDAGSADPAFVWPKVKGLDFKGDGGYAILPYPGGPYVFEHLQGHSFDDMPEWRDLPGSRVVAPIDQPDTDPTTIDLSLYRTPSPDAHLSEWERTKAVAESFPGGKIPSGMSNGRNQRVMRYASDCVRAGHWADDLANKVVEFMDTWFVEPLPEREWRATIRSMQNAHRRNHPDQFDAAGNFIPAQTAQPTQTTAPAPTQQTPPPNPFIFMRDADAIIERARQRGYLIRPLIPDGGRIIQVYGYTGHGKSTMVRHLIASACAIDPTRGATEIGPYVVQRRPRVLYLNFEEGERVIGQTLLDLRKMYGDTGTNLAIWSPSRTPGLRPHLGDEGFLAQLTAWIKTMRPDIVVVDTVRTAWSGLRENEADAWAPVNDFALRLRNAGITPILIHHGNKPNQFDFGREAGSTAQLTNVELQLRVTRVYEDEEKAKLNNAIHAAKLQPEDFCLPPGMPIMETWKSWALRPNEVLVGCSEIRQRKAREPEVEMSEATLFGFAMDPQTGDRRMITTPSPPQAARLMARYGRTVTQIAMTLRLDEPTVREWLT